MAQNRDTKRHIVTTIPPARPHGIQPKAIICNLTVRSASKTDAAGAARSSKKGPGLLRGLSAACCRRWRYRPLVPSFDFFMCSTFLEACADEPVVRVAAPDWPLSGLSMACPVGEVPGTLTPVPLELGCGAFGLFCAYAAHEALAASAMAMLMVVNFFI
jgi:hypothetical protein